MRFLSLLFVSLAAFAGVALCAPSDAPSRALGCAALPNANLQLHKQASSPSAETFQLVFLAEDPSLLSSSGSPRLSPSSLPDYIDIHYRINNEAAVNLRALSQMSVAAENRAPQVEVNGVVLRPGDTLRYFATFSRDGMACDTDIQTFTVPQKEEGETEQWHTQAVGEENIIMSDAEKACITGIEQKIVREANKENSYRVILENRNLDRKLQFVDLHVAVPGGEDASLRLASDMHMSRSADVPQQVKHEGIAMDAQHPLTYAFTWKFADSDVGCTMQPVTVTPEEVTETN